MINFKLCLTDEQALPLQNRIVEDVVKSSSEHPLLGKISIWKGSLKEEFFSVMFLGGVVVVAIAEREMQLGDPSINYAESQSLLDTAELVRGSSPEVQSDLQKNYHNVTAKKEQEEITFADLMFILKWEYVDGAKVDESDLLAD